MGHEEDHYCSKTNYQSSIRVHRVLIVRGLPSYKVEHSRTFQRCTRCTLSSLRPNNYCSRYSSIEQQYTIGERNLTILLEKNLTKVWDTSCDLISAQRTSLPPSPPPQKKKYKQNKRKKTTNKQTTNNNNSKKDNLEFILAFNHEQRHM